MTDEIKNDTCSWTGNNALMIQYHDEEWGVPTHDDHKLFEFIVLETFQAGLSWSTILNKRENFRKAFDNFEPEVITEYSEGKIESLLLDSGIIRNKLKVRAAVTNAQKFLETQKEHGSFDKYIWQFTNWKTIINHWKTLSDIPANTNESDEMSKSLKKRGF